MTLEEAVKEYKAYYTLNKKQLEFISKICYIDKGIFSKDASELYFREGKRDIALTLTSLAELEDKELIQLLEENGDSEWMIQTMKQLQK